MRTNASCTIFNVYRNEQTGIEEIRSTFFQHVFWNDAKQANLTATGVVDGDKVKVYMSFYAEPETKYIEPYKYQQLPPEEVANYWTMTEGIDWISKGIVKGVPTLAEISKLKRENYNVFKITSVDKKDFGSPHMQHWLVMGK